jgi:hypothetical protein
MLGKTDPEGGQQAPDRILHIHSRFDRNLSRSQQVEARTSELGQHSGIIFIGFVVHLALHLRELPALLGKLVGEGEVAAVAGLVRRKPPASVRQAPAVVLPLALEVVERVLKPGDAPSGVTVTGSSISCSAGPQHRGVAVAITPEALATDGRRTPSTPRSSQKSSTNCR